ADYQTRLLGQLPLTLAIREDADGGLPTVASDPEGEIAGLYRDIARRAAAQIWLNAGEEDLPQIEVS
ncbi:iron-sulfur cluster carrier protein ApbC, partial [Microbulbifer thermotolerans]|nr:iron-sulfur cluster carrier protein ApbC [Microbulbifer thermotolerans]